MYFKAEPYFDSMSVYENLAYPLREHTTLNEAQDPQTHSRAAWKSSALGGSERTFPANLSGGMQKRVGLALARSIILQQRRWCFV